MADIEVRVMREVDLDRIMAEASRRMLTAMVRQAASRAIARAPVDRGKLRQSLNPQSAQFDGGQFPTWAAFGPKITNPPYAAYLNAGSYVRRSGKAAPSAALYRWAKRRGIPAGAAPAVVRAVQRKQRAKGTFRMTYASGPHKGSPTKGWFNPGVIQDMQDYQDVQGIVVDTAAWIAARWKAGGA